MAEPIYELSNRDEVNQNPKLQKAYDMLAQLLVELRSRDLTDYVVSLIDKEVEEMNAFYGSERELRKRIKQHQNNIIKLIEKDLNLVTKHHYRNTWMALGMAVFGLPFGMIFSLSLDNMAFIGIGLPIGMALGMALGAQKDKQAQAEGRQLEFEITY